MGIDPPNGVRVHVSGIDLVRGADGEFRVLEDNLRTPSGISYVVENRRTMARVFPELFASHRVRPVDSYPARLLEALRAATPTGVGRPHRGRAHPRRLQLGLLRARLPGPPDGRGAGRGPRPGLPRRTASTCARTAGEQRVDVVYRRVDDDFLDPLQFRADSMLGCPGILNAARAGNVTIANAVGNGVADDKLVYTYVPDMIRYYLDEEPLLPNVDTYRLEEPDQLAAALPRLDELVLKPVDGSGGYGLVIGPAATDEELDDMRDVLLADPRGWIAQEVVAAVDVAHPRRVAPPRPATSTCGPSRSTTASGCGSCPAASPGWRCPRAAWS